MASTDLLTVHVTVERLPIWMWPLSIPRGFVRRLHLVRRGQCRWPIVAALWLGTRRIRIGRQVPER